MGRMATAVEAGHDIENLRGLLADVQAAAGRQVRGMEHFLQNVEEVKHAVSALRNGKP